MSLILPPSIIVQFYMMSHMYCDSHVMPTPYLYVISLTIFIMGSNIICWTKTY